MTRLILVLAFALTIIGGTSETSAWEENPQDLTCNSMNGVEGREVRVMSLNLGNGLVQPDDLVSYLRISGVDLVALLEVTPEMADVLESDMSDLFPFREIRGLGIPGKALLSKHPIAQAEWLELNPGRPDLLATVNFVGCPIQVLVAHPPPPEVTWFGVQQREGTVEQFDGLVEIAAEAELPFLLVGDLNIVSLQDRYSELKAIGLQDVFGLVGDGPGATFPKLIPPFSDHLFSPLLRIDYIWASEEWQVISASTGEDVGSDHLPVIAHLALDVAAD